LAAVHITQFPESMAYLRGQAVQEEVDEQLVSYVQLTPERVYPLKQVRQVRLELQEAQGKGQAA